MASITYEEMVLLEFNKMKQHHKALLKKYGNDPVKREETITKIKKDKIEFANSSSNTGINIPNLKDYIEELETEINQKEKN